MNGRCLEKDVVYENMIEIVAIVSGNGEDDFNSRQILYRMRPIVKEATDQELTTKTSTKS